MEVREDLGALEQSQKHDSVTSNGFAVWLESALPSAKKTTYLASAHHFQSRRLYQPPNKQMLANHAPSTFEPSASHPSKILPA